MNNNPIKIFHIKGKISSTLTQKISEKYADLSKGQWQICLNAISYELKTERNEFVSISCNLCRNFLFNENNQETQSYTFLSLALLKGKSNEKKQMFFSPNWFYVDNPSELISFYIKSWKNNAVLQGQCNITVSIMLRRI